MQSYRRERIEKSSVQSANLIDQYSSLKTTTFMYTMTARSEIQCSNITSSKRTKKKLQVKKQINKIFELENSSHTQSRDILDLVKRNILMCHQNKTNLLQGPHQVIHFPEQVGNRLHEIPSPREPFSDQKNTSYHKSMFEAFECSSITKQLLRKSILEKRKEKVLHELQAKEKFMNYKLWRPW